MAPSDSKIIGNATIWDRDDEVGDGGTFSWLNSQPYPIEAYDYIGANADLTEIFLQTILRNIGANDTLDIEANLNLIVLEEVVIRSTYEMEPEHLDIIANLTGIDFVQSDPPVVHEIETSDSLDISSSVTQILLETVVGYVEYEYDEAMTVSADVTGIDFVEDVI